MDESNISETTDALQKSLQLLQNLRNFEGDTAQYWTVLLETLVSIAGAETGIICLRTGTEGESAWRTTANASDKDPARFVLCKQLLSYASEAANAASQSGFAHIQKNGFSILAVNLFIDTDPRKCLALFHCKPLTADEALWRTRLLLSNNDLPARYRLQQAGFDALKNQSRWKDNLDLLVLINRHKNFISAAMTICNELAGRYDCDRVSLGWLKSGVIKVKAMSHTDNFEKKMEAVSQLEMAMEEALNQDNDIIYPSAENSFSITRDHNTYARAQDIAFMATLTLRNDNDIVGVICFERCAAPFTEMDLRQLRVILNLITSRLNEIYLCDRWFGARLATWSRNKLAKLFGFEHTWAKAIGLISAAALLAVSFIPVRYRVDSPMILRTDDVCYITAPFDGYIEDVHVRAGDVAKKGTTLLSLDKKDLLLEEAGLIAERNRQNREVEKARAAGELADMCIAQARLDQTNARLDVNHYKLEQASIVAPLDGVIVDGDQLERIGSPVKQGEILFRVGGIKDLYAESKVNENEIHNVKIGSSGQIALASRPQEPLDITIDLVEPSAVVAEKDNVFLVRSKFTNPVPPFLRPGMTGISKVNAGRKTLLWIVSHRTIDFLRLKLWW
jgi:multidrug resistance efflux pump